MLQITTATAVLGPFISVDMLQDAYLCDGAMYPFSVVGMGAIEDYVAPPHVVTDADRAALRKRIDADADAIYNDVQGGRASEYAQAEVDAIDYRDADYDGPVPASVQSWADAKQQTAAWAAADILSTAASWRTAMAAIRANRLSRKEQSKTAEDLAPVAAGWDAFVHGIRAALGSTT